ncbi:hypothetical protein [Streptobacillus canis]|uniref:hypothetical protein n=1 Tax=Streptobacillus canis TaxID=2678686 RepID=UPI0012E0D371|nr:hypothetical protein [Streptobacillus canis]
MNITKIASNSRVGIERESLDFYATNPQDFKKFVNWYDNNIESLKDKKILESCAGNGHMSIVLKDYADEVVSYDLVERDYKLDKVINMYDIEDIKGFDYVITNPPFRELNKFLKKFLDIAEDGQKLLFLVPMYALETKGRYEIYKEYPPHTIFISTSRILCSKNGNFETFKNKSSAMFCYIKFIKGYKGETKLSFLPFEY